jgi:Uma2 family endonuclease
LATDVERLVDASGAVVLQDIAWETYVGLRAIPANQGVRMTYLDGTLYLMSPEYIQEFEIDRLALLIRFVSKSLGMTIKGVGSTTLKRGQKRQRRKGAGKEPDTAFHLGPNERQMRLKRTLDLEVDPPPDLAIEVDNKADSTAALSVYARLGVPEVWRYTPREEIPLRFYWLVGKRYEEIERSISLPVLTTSLVHEGLALAESENVDENAWMDLIVEWARALPAPPATS